jgi:hypothetical protein
VLELPYTPSETLIASVCTVLSGNIAQLRPNVIVAHLVIPSYISHHCALNNGTMKKKSVIRQIHRLTMTEDKHISAKEM